MIHLLRNAELYDPEPRGRAHLLVAGERVVWVGTEVPALPASLGVTEHDLVLIDLILGVGELAISDHRSSQPTLDDLLRVAGDAHVGGLMAEKAGIVHLHVGDGARGLELVRRALACSELPAAVFNPTH